MFRAFESSLPFSLSSSTNSLQWFVPTTTLNVTTTTFAINLTQMAILASLALDCPISNNDTQDGWTVPDLADYCNQTAALTEYCLPSINATMPPSTSFPITCSPSYWDNLATAASTTAIPSTTTTSTAPEQTGIASDCKSYLFYLSERYKSLIVNLGHRRRSVYLRIR